MLSELQNRKLIKLFSMYDACNFGVLKISDFEGLAQRLIELRGWKLDTPAAQQILSKFLFRWNHMRSEIKDKVNQRLNHQVNLEEWLSYHDILLTDQRYQDEVLSLTESVFDVVDVDESGHLNAGEWVNLFRVYHIPVIYAQETFARIDRDGDGALSKEEMLSMIREFYYSDDPNAAGN